MLGTLLGMASINRCTFDLKLPDLLQQPLNHCSYLKIPPPNLPALNTFENPGKHP
jgi:hypothetical protein